MILVGLVGSARKMGNSELLAKEAMREAAHKGHAIRLIRLPELSIKPCNGCMSCIFTKAACHLNDDMAFLLEEISQADAMVLAAPTYVLGPAGIVKMITDRLFMASHEKRAAFAGKPAAIMAVAGIHGWEPFALPGLALLPLSLGFSVEESLIAYAPGPGEVLLDDASLKKARDMGERLLSGSSSAPPVPSESPACPLCRGSFFRILGEKEVECPTCALKGSLERGTQGEMAFVPHDCTHRWTNQAMENHINGWIKSTEGRFKTHMKEIAFLRKPYRALDNLWKAPIGPAMTS
jgi:multimeric flavodoxin WrbA